MKQALQNPVVVGILAVAAVIFVVWTVTKDDTTPTEPVSVKNSIVTEPELSKALEVSKPKINTALAQWNLERLERNPFEPSVFIENDVPADPIKDLASDTKSEPKILKLSAIWYGDSRNYAVINGSVVEKGDRILEFNVQEILSDQVILQGSSGRRIVGFGESMATEELSNSRSYKNAGTHQALPVSRAPAAPLTRMVNK